MDEFLAGLDDNALVALPWLFEFWALPHQIPPDGAWRTWVVMGGRGAGKTRAGAEWVRAEVEGAGPLDPGRARRVALVGETVDQVREVMVFGDSGILACSPPDRRPEWEATRKRLVWPNGAVATVYSAHDPDSLRGPQFDAAWVDELGCPAVDKGANQPNVFVDPKSSETALPRASTGRRDDLMQMQYLRAMAEFWADARNNPRSALTGAAMVDAARAHVWAWDARPYPAFPNLASVWSDGGNYELGHWLNGRVTHAPLSAVVAEICSRSGVSDADVSALHGLVRGYNLSEVDTARAALQPLMLAYGFDAVEREGRLAFRTRDARLDATLDPARLAVSPEIAGAVETTRLAEAENIARVRLGFVEAEGSFELRQAEAVFPDAARPGVSHSELSLCLTQAEGQEIADRWLAEARVARDGARFALPPSALALGAGDVVALAGARYRIDRIEQGEFLHAEAVRVEPASYRPADARPVRPVQKPHVAPVPVHCLFLDLPLLEGTEAPHAPHLAVGAVPWPGPVAVWSSGSDDGYALNRLVTRPATYGITETPLSRGRAGLLSRTQVLRLRLMAGALSSAEVLRVLNGANAAAIGGTAGGDWEVLQFAEAVLLAPKTYELRGLLRGQAGTDGIMPAVWPAGSAFVLLDGAEEQISLPVAARGLARHYRIGAAARGYEDAAVVHHVRAFAGAGLRPYRPAHLRAKVLASGDLAVTWRRRTRIDGDGWDSPEVPLGEDREAYLLRVERDGRVLREVTTGLPEWRYPQALRQADGTQGVCLLRVAQFSDRFGPGPFATLQV